METFERKDLMTWFDLELGSRLQGAYGLEFIIEMTEAMTLASQTGQTLYPDTRVALRHVQWHGEQFFLGSYSVSLELSWDMHNDMENDFS